LVQAFYDAHPYPPPVEGLEDYRQRWQDEHRRRAYYHLHWPDRPYRSDLAVLVAGCGTSQAAKHALRDPQSQVLAIDISATSIRHTLALKERYQLENLQVQQLALEEVGQLGMQFDRIVCTGVLHHLPDPLAGLQALRAVLEPDGALHLMIYARYGRAGIYMLQEYARLLALEPTEPEIKDLAATLTALPQHHPLAHLLGESPDFRSRAGLADALLNPQDRAYSVPELFALLDQGGLIFGRWLRQAPYLPVCGQLADTPHARRLAALPPRQQYAAVELLRGTLLRHSLIAYRDDRSGGRQPDFATGGWLDYVPLRPPEVRIVPEKAPAGGAGWLVNTAHGETDLALPVAADELRLFAAVDGRQTIGALLASHPLSITAAKARPNERARRFFESLWQHDLLLLDISAVKRGGRRRN
jgi:SAM-dependent methyltransferase